MEEFSWCDIWRIRNPDDIRYSWYRTKPKLCASRLDYAIVSEGLSDQIYDVFYLNGYKTDHSAICLIWDPISEDRGCSYWKFNVQLLKNTGFLEEMNKYLKLQINNLHLLSAKKKWERIKALFKDFSIKFSKKAAKDKNHRIEDLSASISTLEADLGKLTKEQLNSLLSDKAELQELMSEKIKGTIFRSKCRWYEEGEKSSKYFYSLETARYNAKTVSVLITDEGKTIKSNANILKMEHHFYTELYRKDQDVEFKPPDVTDYPMCPESIKQLHNQSFTMEELADATKSLNNNKCPGPDGLPIEIYKSFWPLLRTPLFEAINECYQHKQLFRSGSRGILNLIPKTGKDKRFLKNLRPITLLNSDYKIIEKNDCKQDCSHF